LTAHTTTLSARHYALLSVVAAAVTIALKMGAYWVTGSVGMLSDALESIINLVAALFAFWALSMAARPATEKFPYGFSKLEYFSSGLESGLILLAAVGIAWTAWPRLTHPAPLTEVGLGMAFSLVATLINAGTAWVLLRASKRLHSITLKADAHHLLSDVWTSVGVMLAVGLVKLTGWAVLDPLIAILVAFNICATGFHLLRETAHGLLDRSLPEADLLAVAHILDDYRTRHGVVFHALQTRAAGSQKFISLHVLVPGTWPVTQGHDLCHEVETKLQATLPNTHVLTHLEPLEDPRAWADVGEELTPTTQPLSSTASISV
jgi:cation diffusion facilitator family transporter